jgi:hypothetical protein
MALEFAERPEASLLLRLASEFDRLALEKDRPLGFTADDSRYFAQRAAQEVTAAVKAGHPKARLAHLKIAQRYEALSQAIRAKCLSEQAGNDGLCS